MRRAVAGILLAAMLGSAFAADPSAAADPDTQPATLKILPGRQGYAFEQPEILIRQRLFGLAHGVSLLAAACLDLPEYSELIQDAYARWHAKQAKAIKTLVLDLGRYYFGSRADQSGWRDLVHALNLKDNIQASLGQISLQDACASLPVAIIGPRYEFDKLLSLGDMPQQTSAATISPSTAKRAGVLPAPSCCAVDSSASGFQEPDQ